MKHCSVPGISRQARSPGPTRSRTTMAKPPRKTRTRFPQLKPGPSLKRNAEKLIDTLTRASTTLMKPNKHGIYPATSGLDANSVSGMHHGWVRDIAKVLEARHICGETE